MVYVLCRMLLRDRQEAEDAAQQTFLQAHRNLLEGVALEKPPAWLATIARNECYRRLGRAAPATVPLRESDASEDDPTVLVDQRAEIQALCQALTELPAGQRQAVVLREFYGLSYQEVAAVLGVSGPAVESLLFKGRRRLQDRLRPLRRSHSLVLPLAVQEALAALIPGFASGATSAGGAASGAVLAKLTAAPLAAKVTAAAIAVGAGSAAVVEKTRHPQEPLAEPTLSTRAEPLAPAASERPEMPSVRLTTPQSEPADVRSAPRPAAERVRPVGEGDRDDGQTDEQEHDDEEDEVGERDDAGQAEHEEDDPDHEEEHESEVDDVDEEVDEEGEAEAVQVGREIERES